MNPDRYFEIEGTPPPDKSILYSRPGGHTASSGTCIPMSDYNCNWKALEGPKPEAKKSDPFKAL
eukprot:1416451-Amphidinium_carterae.1